MGNHKFRLSDMIPNSWFYKLRDMSKPVNNSKSQNQKIKKQLHAQSSSSSLSSSAPPPSSQIMKLPHLSDQRKSYYFTREITFHPISPTKQTTTPTRPPVSEPDPPRKSSRRPRRRTTRTRQPKTPSDQPTISSSEDNGSASDDASCTKCQAGNDDVVVINGLPPIITKKPERAAAAAASTSPGLKLRTNTPKIANRRISQGRKSAAAGGGGGARRSVSSESFAVVKKSRDPGRDFRESMVEMIVENNIRASKDLEELLACYLSLNSDEYHELIINVFKQIWFDFIRFRLKS